MTIFQKLDVIRKMVSREHTKKKSSENMYDIKRKTKKQTPSIQPARKTVKKPTKIKKK